MTPLIERCWILISCPEVVRISADTLCLKTLAGIAF